MRVDCRAGGLMISGSVGDMVGSIGVADGFDAGEGRGRG